MSGFARGRGCTWAGSRSTLWAFCAGYLNAEADLGHPTSEDRAALDGFQGWLEARYPFARGRPWNRILNFLMLGSQERSWAAFYDALDLYRAGDPPDALSKVGRTMLASITKAIQTKSPGVSASDVAEVYTPVIKGICP